MAHWVPLFHIRTGGTLGCDVHYNGAATDFFNGGPLSANTWYHIVVTHSSNIHWNWIICTSTGTGSARFLMGATSHSASTQDNYFPGLLDEARVYNVALTAQEVSSLFAGSNVDSNVNS